MIRKIGVSVGRKYDNYSRWLSQLTDAEIVPLSYERDAPELVRQCDALVLTGGEDVHPRHYGKPEYVDRYHLTDFNEKRDEFELKLMSYAQRKTLPVLGICRGMQLANVFFGGTLIPDIPTIGRPDHSKFEEGRDREHPVWLVKGSRLSRLTGVEKGEVNSAHHQAAELLGDDLTMSAVSPDGIVEAAERRDPNGPFLLLVQWHPERMGDASSPLSLGILKAFSDHVKPQRRN